jgi:hypothetical protein
VLVVLAVAAVAVVVVAHWNPWRYTHLMPLEGERVLQVLLAVVPVLLGGALVLAVPARGDARITAVCLTALLVAVAVAVAPAGGSLVSFFAPVTHGPAHVVALSADGRLEVAWMGVADDSDSGAVEYRIRSRAGLLSRESTRELACMADWSGSSHIMANEVRFTGDREVELRTSDGALWTIAFDPRTLTPARTLSNCTDGDTPQLV